MAEEAKAHITQQIAVLEERLPASVMSADVTTLGPADALGRAALSGLRQLIRIVEQPLRLEDHVDAYKQQRLIGDMSVASGKLYMRAAEGAFRAQEGNALLALLEQLKAAQDAKEK